MSDETPRSSRVSSPGAALSPTWQPPKTPLTPHRLAKLANALGISTPLPASLNHPSFLSRSYSESSNPPEHLRRSPTPSLASQASYAPSAPTNSKFLLHVVPPLHLPHDSDDSNDSDMTPPPPTASGYHTQFRRGTLVPVHPTLQAQLGAIAKEYALPSTAGLVLYLVSSGTSSSAQSPFSPGMSPSGFDDGMQEPGPRLSDDIWRHLWTRVVQVEQRDGHLLPPSRSPTPLMLGNGTTPTTPFSAQGFDTLRPPNSPSPSPISPRPTYGPVTTPSPPSSVSEDLRSNSKSAPPSSASATQYEYTPASSINSRAESLDLPGLFSPSLIPILAKVEFDIDRRKAGWYDPWIRSRKANHAKRVRSRKNSTAAATKNTESPEPEKEKVPAIPLLIGRKETSSPLSLLPDDPSKDSGTEEPGEEEVVEAQAEEEEEEAEEGAQASGYEPLSDTQEGDSDSDEDEDLDFAEDSTARVSSIVEKRDPLEDVFGSDADTWSDMTEERRETHEINPDDMDLTLSAGDLTGMSFQTDQDYTTKEEAEVRELLDRMSQSGTTTPDPHASFSPQSLSKKIPSPLVLVKSSGPSNVVVAEPSPANTGTDLAYLDTDSPDTYDDGFDYRSRSPAESEKRSGALFEDLDLGLDPSEDYDDDDPNDRRKSQIVMKAQLDEIERTLAQLSPRFMKTDLEEDVNQSYHSMSTLSPNSPVKLTLSPLRNSGLASPSRLPQHPDPPSESSGNASWPAVPFSQIKRNSSESANPAAPPTPQLALNGVTTAAPLQFNPRTTDEPSSESTTRRKELEEEQAFFRKPSIGTPVIPLSPDPFGRFSSSTLESPPVLSAANGWDTTTLGRASITLGDGETARKGRARSGTTTSRFSVDSVIEEEPAVAAVAPSNKSNRGTLISVKSIKNLWRKSNKGDKDKADKAQSSAVASSSGSGRVSPAVPQRPDRPSQETLDLPDVPPVPPSGSFGRVSPQPGGAEMSRRPSQESGPPRAPSAQSNRPSLDYRGMPQQQHQQRPSQDFPLPRRSQDGPSAPPPMMTPGLNVPMYTNPNRNNASPIVPAQMLSGRSSAGLDRLRFDQESPYPNPIRNPPPVRYVPRPPSPSEQGSSPPPPPPPMQQQPSLPSIPEQETLARKSILRWKSSSSSGSQQQQDAPATQRTSFDRASNTSSRSGGHMNNGGRKASGNSEFSSDAVPPPSPMPEQFVQSHAPRAPSVASSYEQRTKSPFDSMGSPPIQYHRPLGSRSVSPAASFASSHASIDESQFEIVSPKLQSGFSYPSMAYSGQHIDS